MDISLDEVLYFDAISSSSTGAAVDADSTPTFAIYEEATDTDIGVGGNMTKRTSLTGNYRGTATLSAANGFELGKWYVVVGSATIGGIATKGILKHFRVKAAELVAGYPITDLGKWIGVAPLALSSQQVQSIVPDTQKVDLNTIKTQSVTCAAGVTIPTSLASPTNITAATGITVSTNSDKTGYSLSGTQTFNVTGNITGNLSGSVGTVTSQLTTAQIATGVFQDTTSGDFTVPGSAGEALIAAYTNSGVGLAYFANGTIGFAAIKGAINTANSALDATVSSRLPTSSYTSPPSAATNASAVRTELGTELARIDATISSRLATTFFSGITSIANWLRALARTANIDSTTITEINATTGSGVGTYAPSTDSLQSIRDRGDAEWITGSGGSGGTVGSGADEVTLTITVSGNPLADADVWITSTSSSSTVVAGTLQTNSSGQVTFLLDDGVTYYLWMQKDGYNSISAQSFVAEAD